MDWEFGTNRRNMAESKNGVHAMCVFNVGMKLSGMDSAARIPRPPDSGVLLLILQGGPTGFYTGNGSILYAV